MPEWLTHNLMGGSPGKNPTKQDIALVVIGSLIPDPAKINLLFNWLGLISITSLKHSYTHQHRPCYESRCGMLRRTQKKNIPLTRHRGANAFHPGFLPGSHPWDMKLLYPFSWDGWQLNGYCSDDYRVTLVALIATILVYSAYQYQKNWKNPSIHQ